MDYWVAEGSTSFKAYMNITREELAAAIEQAHSHKLKVTGHLCSVTWHEAIALGIDDLEHGPAFTDSDFVADKKPDLCPPRVVVDKTWASMDITGSQVRDLIGDLVGHHVAVTSTLPFYEAGAPPESVRRSSYCVAACSEAASNRQKRPCGSVWTPVTGLPFTVSMGGAV